MDENPVYRLGIANIQTLKVAVEEANGEYIVKSIVFPEIKAKDSDRQEAIWKFSNLAHRFLSERDECGNGLVESLKLENERLKNLADKK